MLSGLDPYIEYLLVVHVIDVSPWAALEYYLASTEWFSSMQHCQVAAVLTEFNPTWGDFEGYVVSCRIVDLTYELYH